ncbi:hypothetical protein [Vibrio mediterranei]|uniref:hypothetical protein n=1 Tax=Vibrio mediterranei TaxID=689 RepID=UPI00148BFED5|nr:hypothetical protein [Vibrio mediterranei]NOI23224.1 hypothetical protein [Vibrio mediterranei]
MTEKNLENTTSRGNVKGKKCRLRIGLIAILIALSGYYLWVLYLAATPNVTVGYQTYYIDKATLFWGKDNNNLVLPLSGIIEPGEQSPFISREGWNYDLHTELERNKNEGRRLVHSGGVYFNFDQNPSHSVYVKIDLAKSITEPVYVSIDGEHKTRLEPVGLLSLAATLPATNIDAARPIQYMQFETPASLTVTKITIKDGADEKQ